MKTDKEQFVDRFREYMEGNRMTLGKLSIRTGINRRTLDEYRMGRSAPNLLRLKKLAAGTGKSADWWCGLE